MPIFDLSKTTIDTNGTGEAKVTSAGIEFTAKSPEDSVNLRFNPSFDLSGDGLLFDVVGSGLVDIKFYSADKTYIIQQVPLEKTVEIDLQGVAANIDIKKVLIVKISAYSVGSYVFSNFRNGRLTVVTPVVLSTPSNIVPNGEFEFGLTGFEFYNGQGRFEQQSCQGRTGRGFRFAFQETDGDGKASAMIYSGTVKLKKGTYTVSVWCRSDKPNGKFRWFITNNGQKLGGQYWLDSGTSTTDWSESTATFTATEDTEQVIYFAVYSPISFDVDSLRITPKRQTQVGINMTQMTFDGLGEHVVGVYRGSKEQIADLGLRHYLPNYLPTPDDDQFFVDNGIRYWADISGLTRLRMFDAVQNLEALFDHRSLVGYYTDEPDHVSHYTSPSVVRKITQFVELTGLPHMAVVMSWPSQCSNMFQYQTSASIIGTDIYPVANGQPLTWLADKIRQSLKVVMNKPRHVVVEVNDKVPVDVLRGMSWLPIACGADGTWFWTLEEVTDPSVYGAFKQIMAEMLPFAAILGGTGLPLSANLPCCVRMGANGGGYIVGVNHTDQTVQVSINPMQIKSVKPLLHADYAMLLPGKALIFNAEPYTPFVLEVR